MGEVAAHRKTLAVKFVILNGMDLISSEDNVNKKVEETQKPSSVWTRLWKKIGPGFITGAADDDPSGIATYSQNGAMFGYGLLWAAPYTYPFMVAVQELCGRIGMVTGGGIATVMRKHYSRKVLVGAIFLLVIANVVNIGADLAAMAESIQLFIPNFPTVFLLFLLTAAIVLSEIFVPYHQYARLLKYTTLSLLAYVATALIVHQNWSAIFYSLTVPHLEWNHEQMIALAAFLGTTISPYLFFWQANEEVEEEIEQGKISDANTISPKVSHDDVKRMRTDTTFGMLFSQIITVFIILSVAATLGAHGLTTINTASDAAQALRPLAGEFAYTLFALGIIGTGLLAIPVLAGSAGYAVAEAFGWSVGLGKKFGQARGFYLIIALATGIGLFVNFVHIPPMIMLYYSAVINGVLAPPLLIILILIGNNKKILGEYTNSRLSNVALIIITTFMAIVAISLFL